MNSQVACPKCRKPADARRGTCSECGVDLLSAFESRALGRALPPKPRRRRNDSRPFWLLMGLLLCGAGAAVFARGLWILAGPQAGKPLPDRAYVDAPRRFAFAPPSGWQLDVLDEDAGGGLRRAVRLTRGSTTLEVCVGDAALVAEADAALLKRALYGADPVLASASRAELDGLPARRLEASAGRAYLPSSQAGRKLGPHHAPAPAYESVELSAVIVAAADARTAYVAKAFGDKEVLAADLPDVERWLASIRILARPWRP